jgi:histone-lysine N-methyltransferase SETD3
VPPLGGRTLRPPLLTASRPRPRPHRYGRVTRDPGDPALRTLRFPAFRPAAPGGQAFISYGPVPNLKLLCFYGFAVAGNPHDLFLLRLEVGAGARVHSWGH